MTAALSSQACDGAGKLPARVLGLGCLCKLGRFSRISDLPTLADRAGRSGEVLGRKSPARWQGEDLQAASLEIGTIGATHESALENGSHPTGKPPSNPKTHHPKEGKKPGICLES